MCLSEWPGVLQLVYLNVTPHTLGSGLKNRFQEWEPAGPLLYSLFPLWPFNIISYNDQGAQDSLAPWPWAGAGR